MKETHLITMVTFISILVVGSSSAASVCYVNYGCFSNDPPFNNLLMMLPQEPTKIATKFFLYTRSNREAPQLIDDSDEGKLENSSFTPTQRTIIGIHGYQGDVSYYHELMVDALLDREDSNVILVDWTEGANGLYGQAVGNTRLVGAQIAELISFLISNNVGSSISADRFYIVGNSLGAHVAGHAGRNLRDRGMPLGRITGLDPAGPYFYKTDPAVRLDPTDAKYVDVIHTNAGFFGIDQNVGHIDFYPNGGSSQPGCDFNIFEIAQSIICDHERAPDLYIASIQGQCSWKAHTCRSSLHFKLGLCKKCIDKRPSMGYDADRTNRTGTFYIKTTSEAPFCSLP